MRLALIAGSRLNARSSALTLIEMIGVVAILAVLTVLLSTAGLRHLDRIASERELATLRGLSVDLQKTILRTRSISNVAGLAAAIALDTGKDIGDITNNARSRQRVFWMDQAGWLSNNVPYVQTSAGTPLAPTNARLMILSSIGAPLPVTSGMVSAADFAALWSCAEDTLPAAAPWTSIDPHDVKIQRVNLAPLFARLVLSTYTAATNGQYRIDGGSLVSAPRSNGVSAYYLKGSVATFVTGAPANQTNHTVILNQDSSFVYEYGTWRSSIIGGESYGLSDVSGIVAAFLAATPNQRARLTNTNAQQIAIVSSFVNYMSNYNAWASNDFPQSWTGNNSFLDKMQRNMMSNVAGLFSTAGSYNNYPTNSAGCP